METIQPLKSIIDQTFTLMESRGKQETPSIGISAGYVVIDQLLGGFQK